MFNLDGLDIQTIREALISRDAELREILNFYKSNGLQCPFLIENSLECVSRVMKKITNIRNGEKNHGV